MKWPVLCGLPIAKRMEGRTLLSSQTGNASKVRAFCLALLVAITLGCGTSGNHSGSSNSVSGAYEFVVTSNVTGSVTLIEAQLTANGTQSSATGPNQVQILTLEKKIWYVNGVCPGSVPGHNGVATSLSNPNISLTFNEGGNVLPGQGMLTGTTISGNYSVTGSKCQDLIGIIGYPPGYDQGGFLGNQVPKLSGMFSGSLNLPAETDDAALTLTEKSNQSLTVAAALTGPANNGTYSLTGSAIGNIIFVSGSVNGQTLTLLGYYDRLGAYTGFPGSLLVFDYSTQAKLGVLLSQ